MSRGLGSRLLLIAAVALLVAGVASGEGAPRLTPPPADAPVPLAARLQSLFGVFLILGLAWLLRVRNGASGIPWRVVGWGLGLQFVFAVVVLKTAAGAWFFSKLNDLVMALLGYSEAGARFVFGNLVQNRVATGTPDPGDPFAPLTPLTDGGLTVFADTGAFFAFNVLPTIIFFSAVMAVLYHLGVMQQLVRGMGWVMARTMGTSGAESLSAAANIFVGQTEAPLVIKPFVQSMTRSELHAIMTGGFATVAGGVMAAYVLMLSGLFPDIAGHLVAASVMSAPAALVISKIMWPETEQPATAGSVELDVEKLDVNVVDAAARGAGEGLHLALNVGAMLMAFVALVALANGLLGVASGWFGLAEPLTLEGTLGVVFWPLAWAMGVPAAECGAVGELLGMKTILNEFVAYLHLADVGQGLSRRSTIIVTYALCGFANLGSIGIQLGGIGAIAPERRGDLATVGLRAMVAGTLAAFLTANVAGTLLS